MQASPAGGYIVSESKLALNPSGSNCPDVKARYSGGRSDGSNVVSETSCEGGVELVRGVVMSAAAVVAAVMGL